MAAAIRVPPSPAFDEASIPALTAQSNVKARGKAVSSHNASAEDTVVTIKPAWVDAESSGAPIVCALGIGSKSNTAAHSWSSSEYAVPASDASGEQRYAVLKDASSVNGSNWDAQLYAVQASQVQYESPI